MTDNFFAPSSFCPPSPHIPVPPDFRRRECYGVRTPVTAAAEDLRKPSGSKVATATGASRGQLHQSVRLRREPRGHPCLLLLVNTRVKPWADSHSPRATDFEAHPRLWRHGLKSLPVRHRQWVRQVVKLQNSRTPPCTTLEDTGDQLVGQLCLGSIDPDDTFSIGLTTSDSEEKLVTITSVEDAFTRVHGRIKVFEPSQPGSGCSQA